MKPNPEKIQKLLDDAPDFIGEKGKKWVKELMEEGFGVKFMDKKEPEEGEVWRWAGAIVLLVKNPRLKPFCVSLEGYMNIYEGWGKLDEYLATSPEEYFRKKFAGEF